MRKGEKMKIVILDAKTLTMDEDIDFSIFDKFGDVTHYRTMKLQLKRVEVTLEKTEHYREMIN